MDAIVIGAGPNGLAAAIELARAGHSVRVYEANPTVGGSTRSGNLTLPGFTHDICSAVHPLGAASPFFSTLPLEKYGLKFIHPAAPLAHPFDDGTATLLDLSIENKSENLGRDGSAYRKLMKPFVEQWDQLAGDILGPPRFPKHPLITARFGMRAIRSAKGFAESTFRADKTRALFAGLAAHSFLSLDRSATSAFGLVLGILAHAHGWPVAEGGSQSIANALASYLKDLGGEIVTNHRVQSLSDLPLAKAILCDVTPRQLLRIAGESLPSGFRRRLSSYRYGPAAFKMDWALSEPVPWNSSECSKAATVHLGGSFSEIVNSERLVESGQHAEKPFIILCQPSLFDQSRAPEGKHTLWAYCHVPNGSDVDMTERIENQIERFAPGFRECIIARNVMTPASFEQHNANLIGGDINGGSQHLAQMFTRPTTSLYSTPAKGLYICSSSTPPGGGVHGLCGYHAARVALRKSFSSNSGTLRAFNYFAFALTVENERKNFYLLSVCGQLRTLFERTTWATTEQVFKPEKNMENRIADGANDARATSLPDRLLEQLLDFEPTPAPVISLYLDARADQHGQQTFLPFVRKQLTERSKSYENQSEEKLSFEEDFVRIVRYLESQIPPSVQGLAIFACSAAKDWFEVGHFDVPFERNRLFISDRPHLYPLARIIDQYRRYAVVLADTNRAQIFVFATGRTVGRQELENVKTKHAKVGGWSQARYQRHEKNYHLQHAKEVVEMLERIVREENIEHIILAGDDATVIPLLRAEMPKTIEEKVIDALSLGIDTPQHELLEESLTAFQRHDSLSDMEKVERLLDEYRGDNLGVAGVPETLAALSNGQVEELLIAAKPESIQYDEEEVQKVLTLYRGEEPLPDELDQRSVADELVRRANVLSSATVTFIEDSTRLERVGGVGAFLRYRISAESAAPYEQSNVVPRAKALTTQN